MQTLLQNMCLVIVIVDLVALKDFSAAAAGVTRLLAPSGAADEHPVTHTDPRAKAKI